MTYIHAHPKTLTTYTLIQEKTLTLLFILIKISYARFKRDEKN